MKRRQFFHSKKFWRLPSPFSTIGIWNGTAALVKCHFFINWFQKCAYFIQYFSVTSWVTSLAWQVSILQTVAKAVNRGRFLWSTWYIAYNVSHCATYLPKVINIHGNLTKFWQKQKCTVFLRHGVETLPTLSWPVLFHCIRLFSAITSLHLSTSNIASCTCPHAASSSLVICLSIGHFNLSMEDSFDVEVQDYEKIVDNLNYKTLTASRSTSPIPSFQEPTLRYRMAARLSHKHEHGGTWPALRTQNAELAPIRHGHELLQPSSWAEETSIAPMWYDLTVTANILPHKQ